MKFKNWDDFVETINEYGRHGYVKKKTEYSPFNNTNTMIMAHRTRNEEETFIFYEDEEAYDQDFKNDPYVKVPKPNPALQQTIGVYQPQPDKRKKENRSENYPERWGGKNSDSLTESSTKEEKPKPKPGPPKKKE